MNIFLVDDEVLMVEALKKIIRDSALEIDIAGEAYNGFKALELIEQLQPDLAIIDIRMPKMDGLQLIQLLKEKNVKTKILILSAYRDFDYAQKAIQYGATGYLVKPVDKTKLLEELNRVKQIIRDESKVSVMMGIATESIPIVKGNYLRHLLNNDIQPNEAGASDRALLDIEDGNCKIMLASINLTQSNLNRPASGTVTEQHIIKHVECLLKEKTKGAAFFSDQNELAIIINSSKEMDDISTAAWLRESIHRVLPQDIDIGISHGGYPLAKIAEAYREARAALIYKFYLGPNATIPYQQIEKMSLENSMTLFQDEDYLIEQIKMGFGEETRLILESVRDGVQKSMKLHPDSIYQAFYSIMLNLRKELKDSFAETDVHDLMPFMDLNTLKQHQTLRTLTDYIILQTQKITDFIESRRKNEDSRLIEKVKRYCEENYAKDITLEVISEHINMAKNYFCSVFKKKTGESFWDYLTNLRISRAKSLLIKTELKIGVISQMVGYKNSSHFCRIFKELVGISPNEYKQKCLAKKPEMH